MDPQRREFDCKDVKHSDWICESDDRRFTRTNSLPLRLVGNKMGLVLYTMPGQRDGKRFAGHDEITHDENKTEVKTDVEKTCRLCDAHLACV